MAELTSTHRKRLRSLAHGLRPIVHVGSAGLSDAVLRSIGAALDDHELIKVRFVGHAGSTRELTAAMATKVGSHVAGVIGHVAILYRPSPDPEKRQITLSP